MKILFVTSGFLHSQKFPFSRGGIETQILGISKEFVRKGHEVQIVGRFRDLDDLTEEDKRSICFTDVKTPQFHDEMIGEIPSRLLYSRNASKLIKRINPNVINLVDRYSAYFPTKLNIPKVYTTHNYDAFPSYKPFDIVHNNKINYVYFSFKRRLEEGVMHRSNVIVALNDDIKEYLYRNNFKNVFLIPNGVDEKKYYNKDDERFILYSGRFNKVKRIEYLIQAYSEIYRDYDVDLRLVGGGLEEEMLKRLVRSKGMEERIKFMHFLDKNEFIDNLSRCSVFVLPSLFECMPVVLLEAMASGKPVIASDIPGPKDIITHRYDGFLVEKENVDELKRHIELCLSDEKLRREIGNNARKTIEEKYTFEKVADSYLKLYEELIHNYDRKK